MTKTLKVFLRTSDILINNSAIPDTEYTEEIGNELLLRVNKIINEKDVLFFNRKWVKINDIINVISCMKNVPEDFVVNLLKTGIIEKGLFGSRNAIAFLQTLNLLESEKIQVLLFDVKGYKFLKWFDKPTNICSAVQDKIFSQVFDRKFKKEIRPYIINIKNLKKEHQIYITNKSQRNIQYIHNPSTDIFYKCFDNVKRFNYFHDILYRLINNGNTSAFLYLSYKQLFNRLSRNRNGKSFGRLRINNKRCYAEYLIGNSLQYI